MIAAAYLEDLNPAQRLILMAIADSSDEQTREAAPGLPKLRAWSGLGRSQTLATVAFLSSPTETRGPYLEHLAHGRIHRRAVYRVFPDGVPAIPHPDEVKARYELPTPVDKPVQEGPEDWTLDYQEGPENTQEGPAQTGPLHASTSVSSARRDEPTPSRPVDKRPTSSAPSTGFPGARPRADDDAKGIARRARGAHDVPCHVEQHAAAGEVIPCGRCAHAAVNSDPAVVADAQARARAAARGGAE